MGEARALTVGSGPPVRVRATLRNATRTAAAPDPFFLPFPAPFAACAAGDRVPGGPWAKVHASPR
eukprot:3371291-Heterocapsa_arctica.AAC.1